MNIVVIGNGKVGYTLAEQLVAEDHNVTIVDSSEEALRRASDVLDIMTVRGNGVSPEILHQANVAQADLLVAVTNRDEVNMVCCRTAKNLGAKHTIARIRNPEYATERASLQRDMGIDTIINPEQATAVELSRLLRFPSATNIDTFCRGRVELMGFRLQEGDFLIGKPLRDLSREVKRLALLFCAAEREDEVIIPNGAFVPRAGDKLYLIGRPSGLDRFFHLLGRYNTMAESVIVLGGGRISLYLADILGKMHCYVKIIEMDYDRCRVLSENLPKCKVIHGDGTEQELLESEGLSSCDAFVALTNRDEDNLMIALYAMQRGISTVIAKSNRQNYTKIVQSLGLDVVISPKLITAEHILQVVRGLENSKGSVMNALYLIADGSAEAVEFTVSPTTGHLGVPLKDMRLREGVLIAVVVRGNEIIIPEGSTTIERGDSVIIISHGGRIMDLSDIFADPESAAPHGGTL